MNKITWLPSTDPNIYSYTVESAMDMSGPFSVLATIIHDTNNPAVYDSSVGKFYYEDAGGGASTWYRLIATDSLNQSSSPSAPFQAVDTTVVTPTGLYAETLSNKEGIGAVYPVNCVRDAWGTNEPLLNAAQLKMRHLFGIPLVSFAVDPLTGKRQVMTDAILEDIIRRAVSKAEADLHLSIMPKIYREKVPFDRQAYAALGYLMLPNHPVSALKQFSVVSADGSNLYNIPPTWVEVAYMHTGQINIVPMTIAFQYGGFNIPTNSPNGGAHFLAILGQNPWIPAFWQVTYETGFPDGALPTLVNDLIGVIAAIDVLSLLATTNARNSSHSIGVDGLSQSISTPGPQIYDGRIQLLDAQRQNLINKLRNKFGTKTFSGTF